MSTSNTPRPSDRELETMRGERKETTPEETVANTKAELEKYGVPAVHDITITDPFSGEKRIVSLDRTGTTEQKLIVALADPNLTRDRKDHMLSMYMWERGKESASFFVDLIRSRGEHTKETRAFKSQMRFDFELFVSQFSKYIREQSRLIGVTLEVDIFKERSAYQDWLKEKRDREKENDDAPKDYTYLDYSIFNYGDKPTRAFVALIEMAILSLEEGERLVAQVANITKAREREKGKGIYVDRNGKIFSYDDPDIDEAVKADREREEELKKEDYD